MILGDGKELARHAFTPEAAAQADSAATSTSSGVRRLTISLEPADGQDIGDQLDLCEARFTK